MNSKIQIKRLEHAINALEKNKLPKIFKLILMGNIPASLPSVFTPPVTWFQIVESMQKNTPEVVNFIPLWEVNDEYVVGMNTNTGMFWEIVYSDQRKRLLGKNYQQFITSVLFDWIEWKDVSDPWNIDNYRIEDVAEHFEYENLSLLRNFKLSGESSNFEVERDKFIASIS